MKKKNTQPADWLTPSETAPEKTPKEKLNEKLEETLLAISHALQDVVAEQKKLRSQADDAGKFGEYRYLDGMIDGLEDADDHVHDYLRTIWGL